MMMKDRSIKSVVRIFAITVLGCMLLIVAACGEKPAEAPEAALDRYIKAAQARDFKTLYDMDYMPQRQMVLIYRAGEEGLKAKLDENFRKSRESFDQTTTLVGVSSAWSEKFLFIKDMSYTVGESETKRLGDNPTAKYKTREAEVVEVVAEYTNKATAPNDGRSSIKKAVYVIKMLPLQEIVRGIKTTLDEKSWIIRSIDAREGSVEYW